MDYDWRTWASSSENIHMAAYTGRGEKRPKMIKSLMLSFPVLNNWDWTKQEIGEECGGRAGCID